MLKRSYILFPLLLALSLTLDASAEAPAETEFRLLRERMVKEQISGCLLTVGPNDLGSENEFFPIPYVGMNWKLTKVDNLALAFYARGGMNTEWVGGTVTYDPYFGGPGSQGAITLPGTFGDNTAGVDLMQGFLNLTYARKLSDQFSVGASAIFAIQRFEARGVDNFAPFTRTFVSTFNPATGGQMPKNLSDNGHDMSYGYGASVGLQWNPTDMFSFAAAYTTKMSMGEFGNYAHLFAEQGDFDMPSTWTVGVALKPNERWAFMFDVQDIKYSDAAPVSKSIANLFNCPMDADILPIIELDTSIVPTRFFG